jgi:hypothetical protein
MAQSWPNDGWQPVQTFMIASWCGHRPEYLPVPVGGDRWALVPVWDPAAGRLWAAPQCPVYPVRGVPDDLAEEP